MYREKFIETYKITWLRVLYKLQCLTMATSDKDFGCISETFTRTALGAIAFTALTVRRIVITSVLLTGPSNWVWMSPSVECSLLDQVTGCVLLSFQTLQTLNWGPVRAKLLKKCWLDSLALHFLCKRVPRYSMRNDNNGGLPLKYWIFCLMSHCLCQITMMSQSLKSNVNLDRQSQLVLNTHAQSPSTVSRGRTQASGMCTTIAASPNRRWHLHSNHELNLTFWSDWHPTWGFHNNFKTRNYNKMMK